MNMQNNDVFNDYDEMVRKLPNEPFIYFCRGIDRLRTDKYELAINDFDTIIQINPNYFIAFYLRGRAYWLLRRQEQAISDYNRALDLKPDFDWARTALVEAQNDLNR